MLAGKCSKHYIPEVIAANYIDIQFELSFLSLVSDMGDSYVGNVIVSIYSLTLASFHG